MAACYGLTRYEFDPERDLESYSVWLCDTVHVLNPSSPLNLALFCDGFSYGFQYGAGMLSMPETKGMDVRLIDGYFYFAVIEAKPEEVPQREKVFAQKIKPFIEQFDAEWQRTVTAYMKDVDEFRKFDIEKASNIELRVHFEDFLRRIHYGYWLTHFYWMYPVFGIYSRFGELCQELLGIGLEHPTFKTLLSGFDNRLYQVNRDLWQFGDKARELGLAELFIATKDDKELLAKLEESAAGRKWLEAYLEWLKTEGWRTLQVWDMGTPSWVEDPSLGLRDIKQAIAKGGVLILDAQRERLAKERQETEKEVVAKVPAEQREFFEKLMRAAQRSSVFSEEHNYYLDMQDMAIQRRIGMEFGRRFVEADVIDEQEDILFLLPEEIRKASVCMNRINLRPYVKARKEEWDGYSKIQPKPFYGDITSLPEIARKDAIVRVMAGAPIVRPELKADLYGGSSSPGVVEGVARVIMTERQLEDLQPGEILVTVSTNATWTPSFGIIAGVVTDSGGSLTHALIVARDYGIPAVVATQEATRKIKTGDRIRVDGDNAAIYILEKAG
jgi:pyruvate,water dikinase